MKMSLKPNSKRLKRSGAAFDAGPHEAECDGELDPAALERTAVGLLARREHSRVELRRKLDARGYAAEHIEAVLNGLEAKRLQSDDRFVEVYVRSRGQRGYGPQRIRAELRERGIDDSQIEHALTQSECDWQALLREAWEKKFKGQAPVDVRERARHTRFLQQRGYTSDAIRRLLGDLDE